MNSFPCICSGDPEPAWGAKQDGSRGEGVEGVHLADSARVLIWAARGGPGCAWRWRSDPDLGVGGQRSWGS